MNGPREQEQGWCPDYLYRDGKLEAGVAMFADRSGNITRFSSHPNDVSRSLRMPGKAIFPGLVNAHSHAFQRAIRGRTEQRNGAHHDSFWTWREAMYHAAARLSTADLVDISRMAFLEMAAAGITTVGEFHYLHHAPDGTPYDDPNLLAREVIRAAQETGVRIALLRTAYMRAGWQVEANPRQARFLTTDTHQFMAQTEALADEVANCWTADRAWVGVAPHSVRAVPLSFLTQIVEFARQKYMPIHMHVSEQPAEIERCLAEYRLRPVELLHQHGLLDKNFTAVHATHATDEEIGFLSQANICACPTTERNLGDGIGAADRWAAAGINVSLGSDSNVQIDLLEDARELEYHLRLERLERVILPAEALLRFATAGGARSLHAPGGELSVGKPADFFTVDLDHGSIAGADQDSLLTTLIFAAKPDAICDVYVGGAAVVVNRMQRDENKVRERFRAAMQRIWGR